MRRTARHDAPQSQTRASSVKPSPVMAYDAAQRGAWDARWNPKDESPDAELVRDLPRLRERCIDLVRNDPLAYGVISTISHNVVGRGPRPRSLHPDANVQAALDALWWAWAPHAGWDGMSTWGDQMRGLVQAACMSGDVGVLWPDVGDGTGPRIDLVDARRIDTPKDKTPEVESCRLGVGYDKYGRTQGLYIAMVASTAASTAAPPSCARASPAPCRCSLLPPWISRTCASIAEPNFAGLSAQPRMSSSSRLLTRKPWPTPWKISSWMLTHPATAMERLSFLADPTAPSQTAIRSLLRWARPCRPSRPRR